MPEFLARKKTKTKVPIGFDSKDGPVSFKGKRESKRRERVKF